MRKNSDYSPNNQLLSSKKIDFGKSFSQKVRFSPLFRRFKPLLQIVPTPCRADIAIFGADRALDALDGTPNRVYPYLSLLDKVGYALQDTLLVASDFEGQVVKGCIVAIHE